MLLVENLDNENQVYQAEHNISMSTSDPFRLFKTASSKVINCKETIRIGKLSHSETSLVGSMILRSSLLRDAPF